MRVVGAGAVAAPAGVGVDEGFCRSGSPSWVLVLFLGAVLQTTLVTWPRHTRSFDRTVRVEKEGETMIVVSAVLAQVYGNGNDHMGWDDGGTWVMAIVMVAVALAVVGGVIWAIVFTSSSTTRQDRAASPAGPSARDVLDQRYARGEIETEEYNERRSALG